MVTRTEISQSWESSSRVNQIESKFYSSSICHSLVVAFAIHSQVTIYLFLFSFDNGYTGLSSGDSSNASQDGIQVFLCSFAKLFQFLFVKLNQNNGLQLKAQPYCCQVTCTLV